MQCHTTWGRTSAWAFQCDCIVVRIVLAGMSNNGVVLVPVCPLCTHTARGHYICMHMSKQQLKTVADLDLYLTPHLTVNKARHDITFMVGREGHHQMGTVRWICHIRSETYLQSPMFCVGCMCKTNGHKLPSKNPQVQRRSLSSFLAPLVILRPVCGFTLDLCW